MFDFCVVSGSTIKMLLNDDPAQSLRSVEEAYLAHHDGATVNPDSYFLRFKDNSRNRIIALPASVDGVATGIKWISSFPDNIERGVPRASAVVVLNDLETGYPYALLEGALISAARTAASAVLGARWMNAGGRSAASIGFVGAGLIARNIFDMFHADGWQFGDVAIHDLDNASALAFSAHCTRHGAARTTDLDGALGCDVVVFATNAGQPYVAPPRSLRPGQIVLNISLRDLAPELLVDAVNLFDDVDHCMKANTSPHLAEQLLGNRSFVSGTLAQLMRGELVLDRDRPLVFSPFGMGMLDLVLGRSLFEKARAGGLATPIPGFFGETSRW